MAKMRKRGYPPPKVRQDVVNHLVELYKKNHPEEFQNVPKVTGRGYSPPKVDRDVVEKNSTARSTRRSFPIYGSVYRQDTR